MTGSSTQDTITPAALALLLRDAATLLRSPLVTEDDDDGSVLALRALSDLHALFKARAPRTAAKVLFYAAQVHRASAPLLRGLCADVERWAAKLEQEGDGERAAGEAVAATRTKMVDDTRETPLIVELS